jgi:hypothetical protein
VHRVVPSRPRLIVSPRALPGWHADRLAAPLHVAFAAGRPRQAIAAGLLLNVVTLCGQTAQPAAAQPDAARHDEQQPGADNR